MRKAMLVLAAVLAALCQSCVDVEEYDNTPRGNFDALWNIIDQHYCFFSYKGEEYGLDWNAVRQDYSRRIDNGMTSAQLFEVLGDMLAELRDGHVNLSHSADFSRYWSWYENYPSNFSDTLNRRYLGTDYKIASGLKYRVLDDNIGYIYCESFNTPIGEGNLDQALSHMMLCRGLIVDLRNNGGGDMTTAEKFAARFFDSETLVGYIQHKTGTGHDDFSSMEEQRLKPSANVRWHKRVCVLTNRQVYSAANEFVKYMKCSPKVKVVGDRTGGGAGLPFTSSLPNGWAVRFSACPMYDRDRQSTEFGIAPDYDCQLSQDDVARGTDTIIEYARRLLTTGW